MRDLVTGAVARPEPAVATDQHAALVDALQDGLVEVDAGLHVTYVNDRFCEMTGLAPDALMGATAPYPWWPPGETDLVQRAAEAVRAGAGELETHFRHVDGHTFPVSVSISTARRADGQLIGVVVTARDITERKRAEASLEQRTAVQALVAEVSREFLACRPDAIDDTIERAIERAAVFLDADRASLAERARDGASAVVTHYWDRTPPDEPHPRRVLLSTIPWLLEIMERGEIVAIRSLDELPPRAAAERESLERADVRSLMCIPMQTDGGLKGVLSFHWRRGKSADYSAALDALKVLGDIFVAALERKQAELARRESDARFRKLVQHTSDIIAVVDASGRLTYVSPAARAHGWDPEQVVGQTALEFVHPDDAAMVTERLTARVADEPRETIEFRLRRADGTWRYVEAVGENLTDDPQVSGLVVTLHDVTLRKDADAAVRASEARYRALVEGGPDLIFRLHRDGTIVNVHGDLALLAGGDAAAVIGRNVSDIRPAYAKPLLEHVERALDTGSLETFEYEFRVNEKTRWFEGRIAPIGADQVLDIVRDVTERKEAEAALRESEERFRALVQNTSDAITVLDAEGRLLYASPAVESLFGAKPQWILGTCVFDFAHPQDRERIERAYTEAIKVPGHGETVQFRMQHVDGSWRHVESVGNNLLHDPAVRGVVLTTRDISERKQAEAALRQSEERFRALVQQASDLITVIDPQGNVLYASPAATAMLGWGDDEYLGRTALDLIHPDDLEGLQRWFEQVIRSPGRSIGPVEHRVRHADGSWRQLEAVGTNLLDDPAVGGIVVTSRDVTERRALEDQLVQAQKMEAVGRLAGGIAHDFNNLLTAISGYTALLLDDLAPDDPRRSDLVEIDHAASRGAALVDQLLAFSRRKMLQPTVLDLDEVVHSMRGLLSRIIGDDVDLITQLHGHLPGVRADRTQIEQVVLNLVVNARDAMPRGGQLHIETARLDLDERRAAGHLGASAGPHVMLAVSDTGIGMDSETRAQAFEPFFTTKEPGQGTGLGLSTVYGIVAQAGGHLTVDTELEKGSVFRAYFPVVRAGVDAVRPSEPTAAPSGRETILVVEDESAVRALARDVLSRLGYQVLEAADGREALVIADTYDGHIDLLVSDVVLPHLRGVEVADRLHARRPDLRVLYISGYTESAIMRDGQLEADVNFLAKPFRPIDLASRVRKVLDA